MTFGGKAVRLLFCTTSGTELDNVNAGNDPAAGTSTSTNTSKKLFAGKSQYGSPLLPESDCTSPTLRGLVLAAVPARTAAPPPARFNERISVCTSRVPSGPENSGGSKVRLLLATSEPAEPTSTPFKSVGEPLVSGELRPIVVLGSNSSGLVRRLAVESQPG